MAQEMNKGGLRDLTAQIAAAYVSGNGVEAASLPDLIRKIYATLDGLGRAVAEPERPVPAVPPKKSVFPDYIICLEDGKKLKMLKRHLKTAYNLTPDEYRERWGLPHDYPMVAPNYASHRSSLARKIGLGTKRED
ncbi:MucR family transcriptional regulator [Nguyenibacter sp. L1]|uniref:MucR family transcriptional regulator n=1 Tax=Nguyenibacter sp. L1 TaxID=3049350 RepID=UPI002B492861|nr:MucR family transcriptional regulator [Nguyenibacter sp. L1]WRH86434.1 MucR family transcriptional regulator [Nguyenibacter sp. L1]